MDDVRRSGRFGVTPADHFHWRQAALSDAGALADAAREMFVSAFAKDNTPDDMRAYTRASFGRAIQARQILDPFRDTLLLSDADGLIGYAQVDYGPAPAQLDIGRPAGIQRFYLVGRVHGSGAANVLFDAVATVAAQRGAECMWLGVWERNARAIAYYRKRGFVERADTQFMLGRDLQRDLLLVRDGQG